MPSWKTFIASCVVAALTFGQVNAQANAQESHTVTFENKCDSGTPILKAGGKTLSTGQPFKSTGPVMAAIAFLQNGSCGPNGENCTLVETTLRNPTVPGSGSGTDLSLIPPHAFSVTSGFRYSGCNHAGKVCDNPNCTTAAHDPAVPFLQTVCFEPNVDLVITFCK